MYTPEHFAEHRPAEIRRIIEAFPLAALVVDGPAGLSANHLPLLPVYDDAGVLIELTGHFARASHLTADLAVARPALVIFQADDAYVSPNWYPSKVEHHRHVPTWNYQVVHCSGRAELVDEKRFLRGIVAQLSQVHERRVGEPAPWVMAQAPADYLEQMLAAIVGLRISVERVVAKSKLSQNREARDAAGVVRHVEALGAVDLARAMAAVRPAEPMEGRQ